MQVLVTQSCSTLWDSMDCNPSRLLYPWNSPGQNAEMGSLSLSPGDLPNPGIEPRFLALQVDSLPAEPQGKPQHRL